MTAAFIMLVGPVLAGCIWMYWQEERRHRRQDQKGTEE